TCLKNRSSRGNEALIPDKRLGFQGNLSLVTSAATRKMGFLKHALRDALKNIVFPLACLVALTCTALAGPWPAWRGSDGTGIAKEKGLPLHWSTNQNVRWRTPLPERGISTPVVWGNRIFITQPIQKQNSRTVMCFNSPDGKLLWQTAVPGPEKEPIYPENPPCSSTPVVDGKRVIAWFGSAGVYCYDFMGRELWRRDLGPQVHMWGYASSLALYRNLCFLNFGPGKRSFILALDKNSGKTVWKFDVAPVP